MTGVDQRIRRTPPTAIIALTFALLLTGCSSNKSTVEGSSQIIPRLPECSQSEIDGGSAWIKGQLAAFAKQDFKTAYTFASQSFQSARTLEQFTEIITMRYGFLLNLGTYNVSQCSKQSEGYIFDVQVTSTSGANFPMKYALSKNAEQWGIEAATLISTADQSEPTTPIV